VKSRQVSTALLEKLNILQAIGKVGVSKVEDILFRNAIDTATATNKITEIVNSLNEGARKINLISEGLQGIIIESDYDLESEAILRVSFLGDASISNVKDFKDWGAKWHDIGRGIAMAHDSAPESIKIIGASKGSVILELLTIHTIAFSVSQIILAALKVTERVQDIRKKALEIENLTLQNKKIAKDLSDSAEQEKENGVKNIIEEQKNILKLTSENGDKIIALEKSIKTLLDFIDSGGEIDFIVPEENSSSEESEKIDSFKKIRESSKEIRAIKEKLRLIERKNNEPEV
jgi:hypothetical protein